MPPRTFIARQESQFLASSFKDRLILLLGANTAGDLKKLKPVLIYHSKNPMTLKNYAESTLPLPCKWNNKAW